MTSAELATEDEELRKTVLRIIDAYRMGAAVDARDLYPRKSAPEAPPPERAFGPAEGYIRDGV